MSNSTPMPSQPLVDHVIFTRYNLPSAGSESLIRAQEGWLRDRTELFLRHTIPSMQRQSCRDYRWIIFFDPQSPEWLLDRLQPFVDSELFLPVYTEEVSWPDLVKLAQEVTGAAGSLLITTNVDNDDAVAVDFVDRIQAVAKKSPGAAIYLGTGLICSDDSLYIYEDRHNAFCSVSETWDNPQTAWRDWHNLLSDHFPVVSIPGEPGWLQVIHGRNVSNRVRGRRVDPREYSAAFPDQLTDLPTPTAAELAVDHRVLHPARVTRDAVRRAGKEVILRVGGKAGLDRVKERLQKDS